MTYPNGCTQSCRVDWLKKTTKLCLKRSCCDEILFEKVDFMTFSLPVLICLLTDHASNTLSLSRCIGAKPE